MTTRRILTTALLVGVGLIGILSVTQGIRAANAETQNPGQRYLTANADSRGPNGGRLRKGRMAHLCEENGVEGRVEKMGEVVTQLELTNTQEQYWNDVVTTASNLDLEAACESGDRAAIREVAQDMREPMHTFFESLSDEQREELRELRPERPHGDRRLNRQEQDQ